MNPPFGLNTSETNGLLRKTYPLMKSEISSGFIERAQDLILRRGKIGVLHPRTLLFLGDFIKWREKVFIGSAQLQYIADLGLGVLDEALVEVAATILTKSDPKVETAYCIRMLNSSTKEHDLYNSILNNSKDIFPVRTNVFENVPGYRLAYWLTDSILRKYEDLPNFGHSIGNVKQGLASGNDFRFLRSFWEVPESRIGKGNQWLFISKGGEYSPYVDDIHLVAEWQNEGELYWNFINPKTGRSFSNIWMLPGTIKKYFYKPGASFPQRTTSGFAPKLLPANTLFSHMSMTIFPHTEKDLIASLVLTNSRPFSLFVEAGVGGGDTVSSGSAARRYTQNIVESIPCPKDWDNVSDSLYEIGKRIIENKIEDLGFEETSAIFTYPSMNSPVKHNSIIDLYLQELVSQEIRHIKILKLSFEADKILLKSYELSDPEREVVDKEIFIHPFEYNTEYDTKFVDYDNVFGLPIDQTIRYLAKNHKSSSRAITKKVFVVNRRLEVVSHYYSLRPDILSQQRHKKGILCENELYGFTSNLISYILGCAFGRWDIRIYIDLSLAPNLPTALEPLPKCSPGMLIGPNGLPATQVNIVSKAWLHARQNAINLPLMNNEVMGIGEDGKEYQATIFDSEYPVNIEWDGILVDDPGLYEKTFHPSDIALRVHEVLKVLWPENYTEIEAEACEILGVKDLRGYFRKPTKFFADHLKRYTKSRRKAPIFWPLSTASGNYTLWIYYHRLDGEILYTAVNRYIEPKIENVGRHISAQEKDLAQLTGKAASDLKDKLDAAQAFLIELHEFRDELLRIAALPYKPNLNDGVIINAAPFHKLFGLSKWAKDTKATWDKLEAGEYDWAHLAHTIWPERVRELCKKDKSIAIAHGLEELYQG